MSPPRGIISPCLPPRPLQGKEKKRAAKDAAPAIKKLADLEAEAAAAEKKFADGDAAIQKGREDSAKVDAQMADYEKEKAPGARAAADSDLNKLKGTLLKAGEAEFNALTVERDRKETERRAAAGKMQSADVKATKIQKSIDDKDSLYAGKQNGQLLEAPAQRKERLAGELQALDLNIANTDKEDRCEPGVNRVRVVVGVVGRGPPGCGCRQLCARERRGGRAWSLTTPCWALRRLPDLKKRRAALAKELSVVAQYVDVERPKLQADFSKAYTDYGLAEDAEKKLKGEVDSLARRINNGGPYTGAKYTAAKTAVDGFDRAAVEKAWVDKQKTNVGSRWPGYVRAKDAAAAAIDTATNDRAALAAELGAKKQGVEAQRPLAKAAQDAVDAADAKLKAARDKLDGAVLAIESDNDRFPFQDTTHDVIKTGRDANFVSLPFTRDLLKEVNTAEGRVAIAEAGVVDADIDKARVEKPSVDTKKKMLVRPQGEGGEGRRISRWQGF